MVLLWFLFVAMQVKEESNWKNCLKTPLTLTGSTNCINTISWTRQSQRSFNNSSFKMFVALQLIALILLHLSHQKHFLVSSFCQRTKFFYMWSIFFVNTALLNHYQWEVTDLNISLQILPCTYLPCTFLSCVFLAWTFLLLWCYFLNIIWFRLKQKLVLKRTRSQV